MPNAVASQSRRFIERIAELRRRPVVAYGVAILTVAVAALLRLAASAYLSEGLPFLTFYPAVIVATLLGGFGPGVLSLVLSAAAADFLFLPPVHQWHLGEREFTSLAAFVALAGFNLIVVAALHAALDRVRQHEHSMALLVESAPNGLLFVDQDGGIELVNSRVEQLFGRDRAELLGQRLEALLPGAAAEIESALKELASAAADPPAVVAWQEGQGRRGDASEFPIELGLSPIRHDGARSLLVTVIDVSERKLAQDRQQLLVNELRHRAQNLITVIQTIALRSLQKVDAKEKQEFLDRLVALGRAHALLADAAWRGAPLKEILDRGFAAFSSRVVWSGCDIVLSPAAAQQFALIVHELATNAVKHGSLSATDGRVAVECSIEQAEGSELFRFAWRESDGPPVAQPARKGFGSTILVEAARGIGREVAMAFEPTGLRYVLTMPLGAIAAAAQPGPMAAEGA
jgi:PAS domain S-box-containing protein